MGSAWGGSERMLLSECGMSFQGGLNVWGMHLLCSARPVPNHGVAGNADTYTFNNIACLLRPLRVLSHRRSLLFGVQQNASSKCWLGQSAYMRPCYRTNLLLFTFILDLCMNSNSPSFESNVPACAQRPCICLTLHPLVRQCRG